MPSPASVVGRLERDADADRIADQRDVLALAHDPRLADRQDIIVELGHVEALAVEQLILEEDDRVLAADRGLEQALGVGRVIGRDDDQAGHAGVPRAVILAVLRADPARRAVGPAEHDRAAHLAARHIIGLGRRIDDVVDRLHREVEGHELDDRLQPAHRRARAEAGKAIFGDRRVDHALRPELVEQALGDLVGALILGDFLAHHEHAVVAAHFLGHRVAQALRGRWSASSSVPAGTSGSRWRRAAASSSSRAPVSACLRRRALGSRLPSARRGRLGGSAAGAGGAAASPSPPISAMTVPTFTPSVPSGTRILRDRAFVDRFELHRRLVGLDLGQDVAGRHAVAFLDQPFGERALFHRRRERGHLEFDRHQ